MSDYTPTTDEIGDAWCSRYDGEHSWASGEELRRYEAEFDRWLAGVQAQAITAAADEAEHTIATGDVAEASAYVSGESGRSGAIDDRDALLEDPVAWLRQHAQNIKTRQEMDA